MSVHLCGWFLWSRKTVRMMMMLRTDDADDDAVLLVFALCSDADDDKQKHSHLPMCTIFVFFFCASSSHHTLSSGCHQCEKRLFCSAHPTKKRRVFKLVSAYCLSSAGSAFGGIRRRRTTHTTHSTHITCACLVVMCVCVFKPPQLSISISPTTTT